jgi:hypothetical protein
MDMQSALLNGPDLFDIDPKLQPQGIIKTIIFRVNEKEIW